LYRFQLREVRSHVFIRTAQSYVWTPISLKMPNNSKLHPSERHDNTFGPTLEFEKIPAFLYPHEVGRQLALVRTLGQHRPNTEILDKEIACIHSAFIRMSRQHCPMAIMCRQSATIRTLGNTIRTRHKYGNAWSTLWKACWIEDSPNTQCFRPNAA
jgi:hypothetical protein